jgi:GNAT superfamily N-acetyltransferase
MHAVTNLDDGRLRAQVTHAAFSSTAAWEAYAAEYAQFIRSAVYDGARDLFVHSPDGRGASACTIWFDAVNGVGLFEPVATHPDFQGKGLGKAVMAEGLRRMKAAACGGQCSVLIPIMWPPVRCIRRWALRRRAILRFQRRSCAWFGCGEASANQIKTRVRWTTPG